MKYLIVLLFLFVSCGDQNAEKKVEEPLLGNPNPYSWSQAIKPAQTYDEGEMEVATSVCQALQQKRATLARNGGRLDLNLKMRVKECSSLPVSEQRTLGIVTMSRSGNLSIRSGSAGVGIIDDVLSDEHPKLKPFCELVLRGEAPNNSRTDGALQYQVNFFQAAGYEWVQIVEFSQVRGKWLPFLIDRAGVITDYATTDSGAKGFSRTRTLNRPCSNRNTGQFTTQEIL